jgi:hypothetical protein
MNFNLQVKEILQETFILTGKIDDKKIINNLINIIKNTKDTLLSNNTNVKGHFTGFKSLVENEDFLNFLKIIQKEINIVYQNNFKIIDAWGNICRYGEEVLEHNHRETTAFCGILYLTENGPGTYFKEYNLLVNEEVGKFVLFHPYLCHSVAKLEKNIERISLAFNMNEIKSWENSSNIKWLNKNEI